MKTNRTIFARGKVYFDERESTIDQWKGLMFHELIQCKLEQLKNIPITIY